jgi:hypothetical protein
VPSGESLHRRFVESERRDATCSGGIKTSHGHRRRQRAQKFHVHGSRSGRLADAARAPLTELCPSMLVPVDIDGHCPGAPWRGQCDSSIERLRTILRRNACPTAPPSPSVLTGRHRGSSVLMMCLVGLFAAAFAFKKPKANQRARNLKLLLVKSSFFSVQSSQHLLTCFF